MISDQMAQDVYNRIAAERDAAIKDRNRLKEEFDYTNSRYKEDVEALQKLLNNKGDLLDLHQANQELIVELDAAIERAEVAERDAYVCNEWSVMAISGIQWLLNIRDGYSEVIEALKEMESNLQRIRELKAKIAVEREKL